MNLEKNTQIAIIGLGYVGLPLAVEFSKKYTVIGFDIDRKRVEQLSNGTDHTLEVSKEELREATYLSFSYDIEELTSANVYIVTVPTPIDKHKRPDFNSFNKG